MEQFLLTHQRWARLLEVLKICLIKNMKRFWLVGWMHGAKFSSSSHHHLSPIEPKHILRWEGPPWALNAAPHVALFVGGLFALISE